MTTKPNMVLVVFEDVLDRDLSGSARAPHWNSLVLAGRYYGRAQTMPLSSQSRACIEFGRYGRNLVPPIREVMSPFIGPEPAAGETTLALQLKSAGYSCGLFGKWDLGRNPLNLSGQYLGAPLARGYDTWRAGVPANLTAYTNWLRVDDAMPSTEPGYATIVQVAEASAWWNATVYPKFMHLAISAARQPFHNPPADLTAGGNLGSTDPRVQYELMIRSVDWVLGQIAALSGIATTTLVCVCSDGGTPSAVPGPGQNPNRLNGTAYLDGARVPVLWYGPTLVTRGRDPRLAHLVDVPATFLTAAGVAVPVDWDGVNMLTHFSVPIRTHAVIEAQLGSGSLERGVVRDDGWKLIRHPTGSDELYDTFNDPLESSPRNLNDPNLAAILADLRSYL